MTYSNRMDRGFLELKKLEEFYLNSPNEIRDYIYSRIIEIESETSCGCLLCLN